jgi:hypothetical protein
MRRAAVRQPGSLDDLPYAELLFDKFKFAELPLYKLPLYELPLYELPFDDSTLYRFCTVATILLELANLNDVKCFCLIASAFIYQESAQTVQIKQITHNSIAMISVKTLYPGGIRTKMK